MEPERIWANVAVTLVGAGRVADAALDAARARAPRLFAADGGAHALRARGLLPEAVIGDLDSLGPREPWEAAGVRILPIAEQETTDFAKCLRTVEAPLHLAVGFTEGRLDHALATLSAMAAMPERRVIAVGEEDVTFLAPLDLALDLPAGTRVSLWPLAPVEIRRTEGLHWPASGLTLAPDGRTGTSNLATGGRVRVVSARRALFAVLPLAALDAAIAAVTGKA